MSTMISKPLTFLIALLYGVSWVFGCLSLLAAVLVICEGGNPLGLVPSVLGPFGLILLVHSRLRLFPFHKQPKS